VGLQKYWPSLEKVLSQAFPFRICSLLIVLESGHSLLLCHPNL
jgi:hypothetical protein